MGNFAENLNLGNRFRPPLTFFCDHTYKLNCVLLWENHKNLFFNTQKLDHHGNKMWPLYLGTIHFS